MKKDTGKTQKKNRACSQEHLSSSMEDYLETIYMLSKGENVARVRDISSRMDVRKPSVNSAVKNLSEKGLVYHERYGHVSLTSSGKKVAERIRKRHDSITRFLSEILCVDPEISARDACRIEHVISPETSSAIIDFLAASDDRFHPGRMVFPAKKETTSKLSSGKSDYRKKKSKK